MGRTENTHQYSSTLSLWAPQLPREECLLVWHSNYPQAPDLCLLFSFIHSAIYFTVNPKSLLYAKIYQILEIHGKILVQMGQTIKDNNIYNN